MSISLLSLSTGIFLALSIWFMYQSKKWKSKSQELEIKAKQEIERNRQIEGLFNELENFFHCMTNSLPACLIGVNVKGQVTHWNLSAESETGLGTQEVMGKYLSDAFPDLPVSLSAIKTAIESQQCNQKESIQVGKGHQAKFLDIAIYPLLSNDISGAVILAEDVTPRVRMEHMLIQNEKMMGLGEMAAGVAHEINNPLAAILNNTQNILRRTNNQLPKNTEIAAKLDLNLNNLYNYLEEREIIQFLRNIQEAGQRAADIVKNMLEFSRSNNTSHEYVDIGKLIKQSLELISKSLELKTGFGIEMPKVKCDFSDNLPTIKCSKVELQQVFMNLLRNAAQAFKSDEYGAPLNPEVIIRIESKDEAVLIEIEDNGPGMSDEVKNHIFEPFFTTKDVGKGTGLGLSVTYFIITEHHKGSIAVDSRPGEGTTFMILLPIDSGKEPINFNNEPSPQLEIQW